VHGWKKVGEHGRHMGDRRITIKLSLRGGRKNKRQRRETRRRKIERKEVEDSPSFMKGIAGLTNNSLRKRPIKGHPTPKPIGKTKKGERVLLEEGKKIAPSARGRGSQGVGYQKCGGNSESATEVNLPPSARKTV